MEMDETALENYELIKQGAEAKLYRGTYLDKPVLIKERFEKKYRHPDLDNLLTRERIKAECRAIIRCKGAGISTPSIYRVDIPRRTIYLQYFEQSVTAKDYLQYASPEQVDTLSKNIGTILAKMHSNDVIHGDLTTSNILVLIDTDDMYNNYEECSLVLIDFGLAHLDSSAEDKAVDLYVLERALISTHNNSQKIFQNILQSYKKQQNISRGDVLAKLEEVRTRGRKRLMVG